MQLLPQSKSLSFLSIWVFICKLTSSALTSSWDVAAVKVFSVLSDDSASLWAIPVLTGVGVVADIWGTVLVVSLLNHAFVGHWAWWLVLQGLWVHVLRKNIFNVVQYASNLSSLLLLECCCSCFSLSLCFGVSFGLSGSISGFLFLSSELFLSGPVILIVLWSTFFLKASSMELESVGWCNKKRNGESDIVHSLVFKMY